MTLGSHHLQDDRLFDCYLADRQGDSPDPPLAEHLADCQACATRYAEVARFMDGLRAEAQHETDAIFTPERLRMQQEAIARRIDHLGRPARVISFPSQLVSRTMAVSTSHGAPRWVAAAAAAGLFVGVALGASYEWEWRARPARRVDRRDPGGSSRASSSRAVGHARRRPGVQHRG